MTLIFLTWRAQTLETAFEKTEVSEPIFSDQNHFDHGTLLMALVKSGVEMAFEIMVSADQRGVCLLRVFA